MPQRIKIEVMRALIQQGAFSITDHALTEGFKDGITVEDMIGVVMKGQIIERYRNVTDAWCSVGTRMGFQSMLW